MEEGGEEDEIYHAQLRNFGLLPEKGGGATYKQDFFMKAMFDESFTPGPGKKSSTDGYVSKETMDRMIIPDEEWDEGL